MPLTEKLELLASDLALLPDAQERLAAIVDRARRQAPLPAADRSDARRVAGCVSVVWLVGELRSGRCYFRSDAESPLVRGLVAFVCEFFTGATPAEILAQDLDPLEAVGIARHLSPTRKNGLAAVRTAISAFARDAGSA
ncbi:MAG: SufE family protein [Opitutaceae bacterium]|nr:SufE family protein [Opitutaceae bacterium]